MLDVDEKCDMTDHAVKMSMEAAGRWMMRQG